MDQTYKILKEVNVNQTALHKTKCSYLTLLENQLENQLENLSGPLPAQPIVTPCPLVIDFPELATSEQTQSPDLHFPPHKYYNLMENFIVVDVKW